ncbi:MAG: ABC transporter ATP-binding protein [Chitinophagaceae bacterium]
MSSQPIHHKTAKLSLLIRIYAFVKPYKMLFFWSIALSILMAFMAPLRPYLIQLTVNKAIDPQTILPVWVNKLLAGPFNNNIGLFLWRITLFQIGFLLFESIIRFGFSYITASVGQHVVKDLRVTTFNKVINLNLKQFDNTPIGTLTTRTINDIESINDIFSDGLIPILADLLIIVITLATMFWMDWQLSLICLLPFPFLLVATYYFKESVNKSFTSVRNAVATLNAFVQEHITGMFVVQAFAAEKREANKFNEINAQHRNANIKAIFAYSVFFPVVELILAISTGLLVWWVANKQLDAGILVAFVLYLNQIFRPLRVIADKFNVLQMGIIAAERVFKVLDNNDVTADTAESKQAVTQIKGTIEFRHVWFAYNEENYVLKDISFSIKQGETVALVGHTGSGKTSIISLLNRLYPINKGEILIDSLPVNNYTLAALRQNIGVVLQDVFLFSGSILDNLTLRNPAISFEKVVEACKLMNLHEFILSLPNQYHYHVMERGATLSLGQRQLISFTRALLYNPSILILDEATSSIDTESELLIQNAIDTLIKGRTSIIIAHRLSTIQKANNIIVLDKGKLLEQGTHSELLLLNKHYAQLYHSQFEAKQQAYLV